MDPYILISIYREPPPLLLAPSRLSPTAGRKLGGTEISYGNKAFVLNVFPRVPLAYLLWEGNEEFPPKIRVLFDPTIQSHLPLDIIWCMVAETSRRLSEQAAL